MSNKRNLYIILAIVLVAGVIYYRGSLMSYLGNGTNAPSAPGGQDAAIYRELSTEAIYKVPNGEDRVLFSVFVDKSGVITDVKIANLKDPKDTVNLDKFTNGLKTVIVGKKLSELTKVDKVGTSSITTDAFNSSLDKLKSQL